MNDFNYKKILKIFFLYILSLLPIIIFFYDIYNLETGVYSSNFLFMGLNPEEIGGAATGAGFFIYLYDALQTFVYEIVGYNYLYSAIVLKFVLLTALFFTGLVSSKVVSNFSTKYSKLAFYAVSYNPFILFIIMVGPYTSVLIFFMLILGVYAINGNFRNRIIGWLLIFLASAWYVFPAFIIPSIILYHWRAERNSYLKRNTILPFIGALIIFIPSVLVFHYNITYVISTTQNSYSINPYSFFILLSMNTHQIAEYIFIFPYFLLIMSIFIPVVLLKIGINEYLSYALLIIIFLTFDISNVSADFFTSAIPFLVIGLLIGESKKLSYLRIMLFQVFIVPQFFILVLRNGNSYYTGFYYWGYYIFHILTPRTYFNDLGGLFSWNLSLLLFMILLTLTIYVIIELNINKSNYLINREYQKLINLKLLKNNSIITSFIVITLVMLLLMVPIMQEQQQNYSTHNSINSSTFFAGIYPSYQWVPPNIGYTISNNLESLTISNNQNDIGIYRNLTDQNFAIATDILENGLNTVHNYSKISLINTNLFTIGYSTSLNVSSGNKINPYKSVNSSVTNFNSSYNFIGPRSVYRLSGNGFVQYNLSYSQMENKTFIFGASIISNNSRLNNFFSLYNNGTNVIVALHRFINGVYQIVFQKDRGGIYNYNFTTSSFSNNEWIPIALQEENNGDLKVFIGDYQHTFSNVISPDVNTALYLGMASSDTVIDNNTFSLNGEVTNLYSFHGFPKLTCTTFLETKNFLYINIKKSNNLSLDISNKLTTFGSTFPDVSIKGTNTYIWIGKLGIANLSLKIRITYLHITNTNHPIINIPYLSLILPILSILFIIDSSLISELMKRIREV